jgi:hypothetical protein
MESRFETVGYVQNADLTIEGQRTNLDFEILSLEFVALPTIPILTSKDRLKIST